MVTYFDGLSINTNGLYDNNTTNINAREAVKVVIENDALTYIAGQIIVAVR